MTQILTGTLLSYKLSRSKLVAVYAAIVPLLGFALFELIIRRPHGHGIESLGYGIIVVTALTAGVQAYRKWARFVTEMHCTEVGVHVNTVMHGNYDISWSRIRRFRDLGSTMSGLCAFDPADEPPIFLYLDNDTHDKFVALLRQRSPTALEVSE